MSPLKRPRAGNVTSCNVRRVPTELWHRLRVKAVNSNRTVRELIIEAIEQYVSHGSKV